MPCKNCKCTDCIVAEVVKDVYAKMMEWEKANCHPAISAYIQSRPDFLGPMPTDPTINNYTCGCGNTKCNTSEKSCWKCGAEIPK